MSQEVIIDHPPSPFVAGWIPQVAARFGPGARALDLAMGRGRHARLLARAGFRTFGVDRNQDAVFSAVAQARRESLDVLGWCADLTMSPLPADAFDVIVVTRYLQRDLFAALRAAMRAGGIVLYETFTVAQRAKGTGPTSPRHLLEHGELVRQFETFDVLFEEEIDQPDALARIVARKP